MKYRYLAAALLASSIAPAFATDLPSTKSPPPPVFVDPGVPPINWGGFFVGGIAGAGFGATKFADPVAVNGTAFTGGLGVGYNWMATNRILLGGVADIGYLGPMSAGAGVANTQGGIFGTVRVRFGYTFDNWLLYGTGGLAYAGGLYPKSFNGYGIIGPATVSATLAQGNTVLPGYTAGGGVEYAFNNRWSVSAEYLYAHFEHSYPRYITSVTGPNPYGICQISAVNVIRLGLNYHFGADPLAPVVANY